MSYATIDEAWGAPYSFGAEQPPQSSRQMMSATSLATSGAGSGASNDGVGIATDPLPNNPFKSLQVQREMLKTSPDSTISLTQGSVRQYIQAQYAANGVAGITPFFTPSMLADMENSSPESNPFGLPPDLLPDAEDVLLVVMGGIALFLLVDAIRGN